MNKTTVLVIDNPQADYLEPLRRLPESVKITISDQLEVLQGSVPEADVILTIADPKLLRAIFPKAARLRWLHSFSAGVESVLFPELVASPVVLTNARGVFKKSLAEFVITSALYFAKDLRRMVSNQEAGVWGQYDVEVIQGKVMGIIGYGETGRACAELARPFGMTLFGLRRRPEFSQGDPLLDRVFGTEDLLEMVALSDYVVLAAPATHATRKLMGETEINAMKPQAVLINVGRGLSVDDAALIRALEGNRIRGAALDVFETEPLPPGHPLFGVKNLLLSPHIADHTPGWQGLSLQFFLDNLERFEKGLPLQNVVDKHAGY
ncbi:MAG: D-2-hydroxyacid dehydrogenase [Terriglobia bacterium]